MRIGVVAVCFITRSTEPQSGAGRMLTGIAATVWPMVGCVFVEVGGGGGGGEGMTYRQ